MTCFFGLLSTSDLDILRIHNGPNSSRTFSTAHLWVVHTDLLQSFSASTALCQQTHHQHLSPDVVLNDETMGFDGIQLHQW